MQAAAAGGRPVAGMATTEPMCQAVPGEDASNTTLQTLLAGALASADAAAAGREQQQQQRDNTRAQGQAAMPGGFAVPWLPPGSLSSWHGYLTGAAPLASPLRPQQHTFGGPPLAAAPADACHTQASSLPGKAQPPGNPQQRCKCCLPRHSAY